MKNKIFIFVFFLFFFVFVFLNLVEVRKKDLRVIEKIYYFKDLEVFFIGKVSEGRDRFYYLNGK